MEIILLIYSGILTAMLWLVIWRKNVWKRRHHTLQRDGDEDLVSKVAIALGQSIAENIGRAATEARCSNDWPEVLEDKDGLRS